MQWCGSGRICIQLGLWIQGYNIDGKAEFKQQIVGIFFEGNYIFQVGN